MPQPSGADARRDPFGLGELRPGGSADERQTLLPDRGDHGAGRERSAVPGGYLQAQVRGVRRRWARRGHGGAAPSLRASGAGRARPRSTRLRAATLGDPRVAVGLDLPGHSARSAPSRGDGPGTVIALTPTSRHRGRVFNDRDQLAMFERGGLASLTLLPDRSGAAGPSARRPPRLLRPLLRHRAGRRRRAVRRRVRGRQVHRHGAVRGGLGAAVRRPQHRPRLAGRHPRARHVEPRHGADRVPRVRAAARDLLPAAGAGERTRVRPVSTPAERPCAVSSRVWSGRWSSGTGGRARSTSSRPSCARSRATS